MPTDLGPVSLSAYGACAEGRAEHKLPGQEGVSDLGAGVRADYPVNDDLTLSLGGAYRQSNAYAFDINQLVRPARRARSCQRPRVSYDSWMAGVEYGNGIADAVPARRGWA